MCRGGQNGEPGIGHSGPIPTGIDLASAKQFEERHGMRGADAVGISHHNQGGRLYSGNATRVEVVKCTPLIGQQQPQMKLLVYPSLPPVQRNAVITTCSPPTANRRPVQAPQPLAPGPFVLRLPCS